MSDRIQVEYLATKGSYNGDFKIVLYRLIEPCIFPDGSTSGQCITAKGYLLPEDKKVKYDLIGEWEKYKNKYTGETSYTLKVATFEEVMPTDYETSVAYLCTLKGVGKKTAKKMYDEFGMDIFDILEKDPDQLLKIKGFSKKKIEKMCMDFAMRKNARQLFQYLYAYQIKEALIMKIYQKLGVTALEQIKENPYCITEISNIGFEKAESIARKEGFPRDFPPRIEAAICEVLMQGEVGGELFRKRYNRNWRNGYFPDFMYNQFLQPRLYYLMDDDEIYITGGTYLPRDVVYLMTLKLLNFPLDEQTFDKISVSLHKEKKRIYISAKSGGSIEDVKFYRKHTAVAEYRSARRIMELMDSKIAPLPDLAATICSVEKALQIRLSDEQNAAVQSALENPISIITGGPGTGKTSVQKGILAVYSAYYPNQNIILAAPTGRAAKRMTESTGYAASTLHSAMQLYTDDDGNIVSQEEDFVFDAGLIIVDEASMIGALIFNELLDHIEKGTRIVFVGDIDQLPSIEVGSVLRELINCKCLPVTRLTKTFRQASGSSIPVNASRVNIGEENLEMNDDFKFIEASSSEEIAEEVTALVPKLIEKYGDEDVVCLTSLRKRTVSGADALNISLRNSLRSDISDTTPFFEKGKTRFYIGDKVMYTRNTTQLTNGDIGKITCIQKSSDSLIVQCLFDGKNVVLEDDEVNWLELAYATTVHKSQGSEYKAVILVVDRLHEILLKRNLVYTGITRAKLKLICIGQIDALNKAIRTMDSVYRRSQLSLLLREEQKKHRSKQTDAFSKGTIKADYSSAEENQLSIF